MHDLVAIQRRFHALVTSGAVAVEPGLVVGPPERLAIYARMYLDRLHDVLRDDYPKLVAMLGDDEFRDLATSFVRARPPTSFTLRDAGLELAAFAATRDLRAPWTADLARLERARVEVFDARDARILRRDDLAGLGPEAFSALSISWVPASTLVELAWSVDELWSAIEDDAPRVSPTPAARTVLVWRRGRTVFHRTLDADEAALAPLVASCTVDALCTAIATTGAIAPAHRAVELLTRWLDAETLTS